ncbi:MAG: cell division protein FtsZ [Ignavibacteriaceae bacterium]|nr:cell division protein FtsZ [Ignavibacteriaceae bacterium]
MVHTLPQPAGLENGYRFATVDPEMAKGAVLKVVGIGGGGCNAVDWMIQKGLRGVDYVAINTDTQSLASRAADTKLTIGYGLTQGLGTGCDPELGKKCAEADRDKIEKLIEDANMVFLTTGLGGGTGSGASPVVAEIARKKDVLVVGIVTMPFQHEGKDKRLAAEKAAQELRQHCDSLIIIPNDRVSNLLDGTTTFEEAFHMPNQVLYESVKGISDIITLTGEINVDFADVKKVMKNSGIALMGTGIATGEHRMKEAATKAISSPLLEGVSLKGAKSLLVHIIGSGSIPMKDIIEANQYIQKEAGEEASMIWGMVKDDKMHEYVSYTIIATGFAPQIKTAVKPSETIPPTKKTPIININRPMPRVATDHGFDIDNLDSPAYLRQQRKLQNNSEKEAVQPRLNFDMKDNANRITKSYERDTNPPNEEESDSSDFLRLMMD